MVLRHDRVVDPEPGIAVTGSTGAVGRMVARALADRGLAQRLLVRDRSRAPSIPGATSYRCSYDDASAARAALAGVETLFMVSGSESADRVDQHRTFVEAATAAGVRHIVYTSFLGAAPDSIFTLGRDHYATEQFIRDSGMRWTFLRDSLYMDSVVSWFDGEGVVAGPADDGRCSFVARADVARVAVTALTDPRAHADRTYELTGPDALTLADVAAAINVATSRHVRFVDQTTEEAYASRAGYGAPDWQLDAWVSTYLAIAAGALATVTTDVETVTGTPPMSLTEYLSTASVHNQPRP